MEKKISSTGTKNEILNAYNELLERIKQSKQDIPIAMQEKKSREETMAIVSDISDEKIIQQISALKVEISTLLDKLEEGLIGEIRKLNKIKEASLLEEKRLNELYQINAEADSLAAILGAQKEKKQEFDNEMAEKRKMYETKLKELEDKHKELELELKKKREREEEEYQYNLQLTRKKEKDIYDQKKATLEKELNEKRITFENEIKSREQALKEAETELADLRKKAESFSTELEKAVQNAIKETTAKLEKEYKFEAQLKLKEHEGEVKLKNIYIESLQAKIKDLEAQLKQALQKAESAEQNTKEITIKAIENSGQVKIVEKSKEESADRAR